MQTLDQLVKKLKLHLTLECVIQICPSSQWILCVNLLVYVAFRRKSVVVCSICELKGALAATVKLLELWPLKKVPQKERKKFVMCSRYLWIALLSLLYNGVLCVPFLFQNHWAVTMKKRARTSRMNPLTRKGSSSLDLKSHKMILGLK